MMEIDREADSRREVTSGTTARWPTLLLAGSAGG